MSTVTLAPTVSVRAVVSSYWSVPPVETVTSSAAAAVSTVTAQPLPIVTSSAGVGTTSSGPRRRRAPVSAWSGTGDGVARNGRSCFPPGGRGGDRARWGESPARLRDGAERRAVSPVEGEECFGHAHEPCEGRRRWTRSPALGRRREPQPSTGLSRYWRRPRPAVEGSQRGRRRRRPRPEPAAGPEHAEFPWVLPSPGSDRIVQFLYNLRQPSSRPPRKRRAPA